MINFTNLISKVSKVSKVSQQNCESRMGTCQADAQHLPVTYLPVDSVSLPSRFRVLAKYVATLAVLLCLGVGNVWGAETSMPTSGSYSTNTKYAFSNSAVTGGNFYLAQRSTISKSSNYGWRPYNTGIALQVSSPVSLTFTIKSNTTSSRTITGQAYAVTDPFFNIYKNTTAGSQTLEAYVNAVNAKSAGSRSSEEAAIAAVSAFAAITGSSDANKKLLICENPGAFSEAVAHGAAISHACPTTKGSTNTFTVSLSAAGKYVIYLTSTGDNVGITKINIVPRKTIYMVPGEWNNDSPKFFVHSWGSANDDVLMTLANCETNVFKADIPTDNTNLLFTRQDPSSTSIAYKDQSGNWNQSADITISTNNKFTFSAWDGGGGKSSFTSGTYSAPTFTVTYNANGSSSGSVPVDGSSPYACSSNATVLGNTGNLAKAGKAFGGWNTESGGGGTTYAPGATILNITDNIILYAKWETAYSVTYNANGGSGSVPSDGNSYANGATVTVLGKNTLTKSDYVFAGWNTKSNGSGTWYDPSGTFSMGTKDITLYAQWAACISTTDLAALSDATATKNLANTQASLTTNNIKHSLGGDTRYDNSSGFHGLKLKHSDDWIGFGVAAGNTVTITTQTVNTSPNVTIDFAAATTLSANTDNDYAADGSNARYFRIKAADGAAVVINKITIGAAACAAPTGLAAGSTTAKGTTFTVTDGENTNNYEFYVSTSSSAPNAETSASHTVSGGKTKTITDCVAGTTYYAWVRSNCSGVKSGWTALTGNTFTTSTVTVTHTLTNVTETSGAATSGVGGSDYTAVFAADAGYSMPTPAVTIDGNTATSGTDYTWTAGTGTLTIPANKINGNIVITLNSAAAAPSSVAIGDNWLWFAGETMTLTATPTGGNGPMTYQWYKGGKTNGDAIEGATDATYSKASCAYEDAGSYYCKVTCGGSESTWGQNGDAYEVKVPRLYVKTGRNDGVKSDYGNVDFTRVDASTATASISLGSNWDYCFNIADGCGHYYGNAGTMQYNSYGPWVTNVNNQDCGLRTTNGATYVFTINYSNWAQLTTTVTFPSSNQAADKVIYFDNNDRQWSNLHYRIGRGDHTQAAALTLVPGTANLYKYTTVAYNNFAGWHIANNSGWTGSNTIYRTYTNGDQYSITYATAHEGGAVTQAAVTVTPTTSRGAGSDAGINDNCTFYNYEITTGMKTQNVSITAPSNGTITVSYTDVNNAAQSFTSGNADLAHTVIITPTATPAEGYTLSGLTVNGAAHTSGNTYTVTGTTVVAATFTPQVYSITYKDQGDVAFSGTHIDTPSAHPTSHTYGAATSLNGATKDGYIFGGWFTTSACTGDAVTSLGATAYTADITLYAKWTLDSGCKTWAGTPSAWTDSKVTVGTLQLYGSSPTDKTKINEGSKVWGNSHTETVIAISAKNNYIEGHFTDGSEIATVTISAANNKGTANTDKEYVVLFCANSSFSTGVTYQTHSAPSYMDDKNDAKLVHEFTAPTGTTYFRIYIKIDSEVGGVNNVGDGNTTRYYRIEACPKVCSTPTAPSGLTNGAKTANTQVVTWTANGEDTWEVYHSTSSSTPGTDQTPTATVNSATYTFTGLTASTTYYWWARAKCDATHKSSWVAGTSFTTSAVVLYTLTYDANGGSVDPSSATQASEGAAITLPTPTRDGYDCTGWWTASSDGTKRGDAGGSYTPTANETLYAQWTEHIASECITITNFATSNTSCSNNIPDNNSKYFYGYKGTVDAAHAVTITSNDGNDHGQNSGAEMRLTYNKKARIYANNTTNATPAGFENVISVSFKWKFIASGNSGNTELTSSYTVKVGSTTIANAVSITGKTNDGYATVTINNLAQLNGYIEFLFGGSSSSYNVYLDDIEICTADMSACTTPVIPSLSNQALCEGANATAWDATVTNAAAISAAGETVSYQWQLKNGSNWDNISGATSASYDVSDAVTEAMAGTYRVLVTVSKAGYSSSSATREVTLSVTESTEVTGITANKATVYPGNSVTLTATANTTVTWQWYTCTNSAGDGEDDIDGATSASYAIASAPDAGTYYYKAKATSSCGTASMVYTLTVSEAAGGDCETEFWFAKAADLPEGATAATHISGTPSGSSSATYTATIDGNSYPITGQTGQKTGNVTIVVPENNEGTLYVVVQGSSSRTITLSKGGVQVGQETPENSTWGTFTFSNLDAGTYTLVSSGNIGWGILALKLCSAVACSDPEVTASADNTTACVGTSVTFTADHAHALANYQWQKLNGTWTNISGATASTYNIASVVAGDAGKYRVIASHDCNRTSNEVTLSVPSVPDFGSTVPASVSVMQTIALSINTVEATDAVKYRWYKSADGTWDAGDVEIGTNKELIKAYDGEAIGNHSYYIFCRAQNSCGTTTSSAIAVNVTAYVEEDCATKGNEGEAQFGFENTSCSQGTYSSESAWYTNSRTKYLTYTAPEGKYFDEAKVRIAVSSGSKCGYAYSTDGGANWTYAEKTGLSSDLADVTIDLTGNVNAFRIGRNLQDGGGTDWGVTSGNFYLTKACFTYINACTATTVTPSTSSVIYEIGGVWSSPTFTLTAAAVAAGGTLTYSSSNEDIASVDDEGAVTFNGDAGSVTITASYAGDGTYCASEGSYTITVSCPGGAPKVVPDGSVNMSGCNSSVTLQAKTQAGGDFADGTYQWFRNGEEIDGATSSSYTARQAGTYTVERTNTSGCTTPSTNSAIVTSTATEPEVERLVPFQYYHVDKTYTDYMKMRHLFAVKNSGKLDGKSFKLYVSRNGGDPTDVTSSNALVVWPNGDGHVDTVMVDLNKLSSKYSENDELVYTCKAIDCSGNVSDVYKNTITMRVIGETPTLALICSGSSKAGGTRKTGELTVGGDFLTGYNVADLCQQTGNTSFDANTEWGLYTDLKANYIVTPVNGYAVFNKLNYEPFDILLLTDYPKASKSDAAKDVLDDMAALCDYRPMLSFKTHMVAKSPSKWAAKGFTTSPVADTKNAGKLNLNIVCYAHPMFDAIKTGDDVYTDVNNTSAPLVYTMLSGEGHEGNKGMQGFEIAAAENFVTIGLTHHDATITYDSPNDGDVTWSSNSGDRMLVTVAERQANIEARMILFSLNAGAHSKLTDKGEQVVLACLSYLLDDDPLHVADCSFTFDNGASNEHDAAWYAAHCSTCTGTKGDGLWSTAANWAPDYRLLPGEFTSVRIAAPVTVDLEHAHVLDARIKEGGQIIIPAGKGLDMKGTIRRLDGSEISPTENEDIFLASNASGNGSLIFNNDKGDSKATVAMYTTAKADPGLSAANSTWQYIGTPHNDVAVATYNYYDSWLYQYDTGTEGWTVIPNGGPLVPFRGYCVTHPETNHTFVMYGKLTATTNADIDIPAGKYVVVANSWTAPIDINKLTNDDLENITDKTIYFFNTGSDADGSAGTGTAAGTYRAAPINASLYTGDWQIPSMQGFYVVGGSSAGALHLDYNRHVRPVGERTIVSNPMYAPRRAAAESGEPNVLKIFARGSRYHDKLVVLERADFTTGYDSGWDGEAWGGSDLSPQVYVIGGGRYDAVSAIPDFEGTVVAFRAGEDEEYTIDFIYDAENEPLYLFDTENNSYTQIVTGGAYHFTTSDKAAHSRFILTRHAPQIATGCENLDGGDGAKAKKLLIEDKMFIMVNGLLYDATGKVVK